MPSTTHPSASAHPVVGKVVALVVLATLGISYLLAQSSYWVNHSVFNQAAFTETTTNVLLSEPNRQAIATTIVDKVFEGRPVADRLIGDRATTFVSSVLGSDISQNVTQVTVTKLYAYLTTPNREDVVLDLTAIKTPLVGIISFVENRGREVTFDEQRIPDQILIVDGEAFPDLSGVVRQFLILGAVFWLLTAGLFVGYILARQHNRRRRAYQAIGVIVGVSAVALFTGPFIPAIVSSYIGILTLRPVAEDVTAAFFAPFAQQLIVGLIVMVAALLIVHFWETLRGWAIAGRDMISSKTKSTKTSTATSKKK